MVPFFTFRHTLDLEQANKAKTTGRRTLAESGRVSKFTNALGFLSGSVEGVTFAIARFCVVRCESMARG